MISNDHSKFHSANAFCGSAGPMEMQHLRDLVDKLSDKQLTILTKKVGIKFKLKKGQKLDRSDYEMVIDEADREDFYREYKKLLE